jgi:hypothetical protein
MKETNFAQRLLVLADGLVRVSLRNEVEVKSQEKGEIILDLNGSGNWVRGFEIVGGFVPFSIARAVLPFNPERPISIEIPKPGTVTYDPDVDAAFFYLSYGARFHSLESRIQADLVVVCHSINPTAAYGLDLEGGLVHVDINITDAAGPMGQFLGILDSGL